jgi:adenosylmethionine-8-amino-7-oxononanoate aminotransferase
MSLSSRDLQSIWHPYTQMKTAEPPIAIVSGKGVYLYDENGKQYIDAVSSWWVNIHGHANPYIAEKISEQLLTLEHVIFAGFTHNPAIELAEQLLKVLPDNQSKIFYSDNGSTAVEVAIKMAIQYYYNQGKKRNKIIAFEHSYHGDTFGAMAVSSRSEFTNAFSSLLFDVIHIPLPTSSNEDSISILKSLIEEHKNEIAAFIFEPLVLGAGGMLMYDADTLNSLIKLCQDSDIITIADEVMTGFGRTGKLFASEYLKHKPDIMCLSKGITGGTMAFGVTSCSQKIYDMFLSENKMKTFFHGHSYTANPIACVASIASLHLLLQGDCKNNINRIASKHSTFVTKLKQTYNMQSARSIGTIVALDFVTKENTSYFNSLRDNLYNFFLDKGIILRPLGNTIYIMPPYCISNEDLEYIYSAIESKIVELQNL